VHARTERGTVVRELVPLLCAALVCRFDCGFPLQCLFSSRNQSEQHRVPVGSLHAWPFLALARCWDRRTMGAWFSRSNCHPFDVEMAKWVDDANPNLGLREML
jgi:hypothetical protein